MVDGLLAGMQLGIVVSATRVAFDLLSWNGRDLRKVPLSDARPKSRRSSLAATSFSESFEIDGQAMFTHACKLGLEEAALKVREGA
jgi:bifunctional non-homologous end joining protein LigD